MSENLWFWNWQEWINCIETNKQTHNYLQKETGPNEIVCYVLMERLSQTFIFTFLK